MIESASGAFGVPASIASWDLSRNGLRHNPRIVKTAAISDLKRTIDTLLHPDRKSVNGPRPEIKVAGYRGHDIYYYESRYFAVPAGQERFNIELLHSKSASDILVGHTINDVQEEINRHAQQSQSKSLRVLFIYHVPSGEIERQLAAIEHHDLTVLCAAKCALPDGPYKILRYTDVEGTNSDQINIQKIGRAHV